MKRRTFWAAAVRVLASMTAMLIVVSLLAPGAGAQTTEKVLYSFTGGADGEHPHQGLVFDQAGNLYGTTFEGGLYGAGNVYTLTPNGDGTWTQAVLYSFTGGSDGGWVDWGRLTFDTAGNVYGATYDGGSHGAGAVFQLSPNQDGTWTENVLHQFTWGKDGAEPRTVPFFDAQGNLFGSVAYGGRYGCGAIYEMSPGADNKWTYKVIHQFKGQPACSPWVGLIPDKTGNLYGTTRNEVGGCNNPPNDCGTIFRLTPTAEGKWTYKVIHKFIGGKGGADPSISGLIFDDNGALYGTTEHQGAYNSGVFYRLTPSANDKWSYRVLHQFKKSDGLYPNGRLVRDATGALYGTACQGGAYDYGTVYKMTPNADGTWTFSVIYVFSGPDGGASLGGLLTDAAGNLYGSSVVGGTYGYGTVFEITP